METTVRNLASQITHLLEEGSATLPPALRAYHYLLNPYRLIIQSE
jgi:hypothetical protein